MLVAGTTSPGLKLPKFHDQLVPAIGVLVLVKLTSTPGHTAVALGVNLATGACPFTANVANRPVMRIRSSFLFNG